MKRDARSSLVWFIAPAYAAASLLLGLILPRLEYQYLPEFNIGMSVSSAQAFLSSVTSGMMALTAIVFSLVFVFSQFSATAYSPRLTVEFNRSPMIYHALGCFIATFTYSLATLPWVARIGSSWVPTLSILIVGALIAVSLYFLIRLIRSLANMNIMFVLSFIGKNGRRVIEGYPLQRAGASTDFAQTGVDSTKIASAAQRFAYHGEPLTLAEYDIRFLVEQAQQAGAVIVLDNAVGDTLVDGNLLLSVCGGKSQISDMILRKGIHLAWTRAFHQDPKYAFRLLVDIAIRALSPAVNDPTTAVQSLDQIEDLLTRLGRREFPTGYVRDNAGTLRLIFPTPTWEDFLALGFDEIRQYGRDSIQVMRRLRAALERLATCLDDPMRKEAVQRYIRHLDEAVSASGFDAADRAMALHEDPQGIGVSRGARPA